MTGRVIAVAAATVTMTAGLALRDELGVWLSTGLGGAAAATAILSVDRDRLADWFPLSPQPLALGLAVGAAMALGTHLAFVPLAEAFPVLRGEVRELYRTIEASPGPILAFPVVALVIVAEELVWRGTTMDLLSERMGGIVTVSVASLLYVVPQVGIGSWLLALVAFGCGLVWSALRRWSGSITAPLVAHLLWDLVVFVLAPLPP